MTLQLDIGWVRFIINTQNTLQPVMILEWYMLNASIWKSKLTMVFADARPSES